MTDLAQKIADAVEVALGDVGHCIVYKSAAVREAIRSALPVTQGEVVDLEKLEALGWQIAVCTMCGTHAAAIKPASHIAELEAQVERLREFVEQVSKQTPEKPDYWSSCGQCSHNISDAEDIIEALAAQEKNDE